MTDIKKRALDYLSYERDFLGMNFSGKMVCRAYVKGAEEQKAIDIDKACKWLMRQYAEDDMDMVSASAFINDFRKAMEE